MRKPRHRRRRCGAVRRRRWATTHRVLYTRITPAAAAGAQPGGRIAAVTRPSRRRGVVAVGGLAQWRCVDCCRASQCCPAPASIMTRQQPPLNGWSSGQYHGTCLSNENSDNADNPSKVVMPPVTNHAERQSVCLIQTNSGRHAAPLSGYVISTPNAVMQHLAQM